MSIEEFKLLQLHPAPFQRKWILDNSEAVITVEKSTEKSYYYTNYKIAYNHTGQKLFMYQTSWRGFKIGDTLKTTWIKDLRFSESFIKQHDRFYGFDWLEPTLFNERIPKGAWIKILYKKITNHSQLFDYISTYVYKLKCTDKGLKRKAVSNLLELHRIPYLNLTCSVNDIAALDLATIDHDLLRDITKECFILGITYNPNWSLKRLRQFHQNNIKELALSEVQEISDITYPVTVEVPAEYELLNTARAVFLESRTMSHCLHMSYQNGLKRGTYVAIRSHKYNATIGIHYVEESLSHDLVNHFVKTSWKINQIRGYRNAVVPEEEIIEAELAEVLDFLNKFVTFKETDARVEIREADLAF